MERSPSPKPRPWRRAGSRAPRTHRDRGDAGIAQHLGGKGRVGARPSAAELKRALGSSLNSKSPRMPPPALRGSLRTHRQPPPLRATTLTCLSLLLHAFLLQHSVS